MCGISGVFLFEESIAWNNDLKKFLWGATYVGSVRGRDSTGMMSISRGRGDVETIKGAVEGPQFVDSHNVQRALNGLSSNVATVIHNRAATHGAITRENAHPFSIGDITLVHNGTIYSHRSLPAGKDYTSDSAAITASLNLKEPLDLLPTISGSYALVWYNSAKRKLFITRNKDRPLACAFLKGLNAMAFCSETDMLKWLLNRHGMKYDKIVAPVENVLYSWDIVATGKDNKIKNVREFKEEKYKEYKSSYTTTYVDRNGTARSNRNAVDPSYHVTISSKEKEKVLNSLGLSIKDRIKVVSYKFVPYMGNNSIAKDEGKMMCLLENGNGEVIIYSVTKENVPENALIEATLQSITSTVGFPDWPTFVASNPTVKKRGYWKKYDNGTTVEVGPQKDSHGDKESEKKVEEKTEAGKIVVSASNFSSDELRAAGCMYGCTHICEKCLTNLYADSGDDAWDDENDGDGASSMVIGPGGLYIPEEEWRHKCKNGCSNCGCNIIGFINPSDVEWTYNGDPLCVECGESEYFQVIPKGIRGV